MSTTRSAPRCGRPPPPEPSPLAAPPHAFHLSSLSVPVLPTISLAAPHLFASDEGGQEGEGERGGLRWGWGGGSPGAALPPNPESLPLPMSEPFSRCQLTVRFVHFSLHLLGPPLSISASRRLSFCVLMSDCLLPSPSPAPSPAFSPGSLVPVLSLHPCLLPFYVCPLSPSPIFLPVSPSPPSVLGVCLSDPPLHPLSMLLPPRVSAPPLPHPPRLREIPQPEQHRGPERGVPAPRAPCHSSWLSQGHPLRSPHPALHPLALPSPPWGDSGVTGKKVKELGVAGWGKGFFKKSKSQ